MVVGDRAPAHQRRDHRHAGDLGELHQQLRRVGVDDAAAGDDQRPLGLVQHRERLLDLRARRRRACRPAAARRCPDRTRSRPSARRTAGRSAPGPGRPERIRWNACWKARGTCAGSITVVAHLRHRLRDRRDVDRLEVLLVHPRARRLAGDAQDRDRVGRRRVEPGDHVGAGRPRRADAHADVAGGRRACSPRPCATRLRRGARGCA